MGAEFTCAEADQNSAGLTTQQKIHCTVPDKADGLRWISCVWMVSLDQYVTENLKTLRPLCICVPINCMHTKKEEPVIIYKTQLGLYIYI